MGQDMLKGRRTEIEFMNGFIADKAAEAGLKAPTHAALTDIVKKVSAGLLPARPENVTAL
jgi:2-dehydropantoate 2-reductase